MDDNEDERSMKALWNKPVYNDSERWNYNGVRELECPFSGQQLNGFERGQDIYLGAAMHHRIKHTEYTDLERERFLEFGDITYVVEPYGGLEEVKGKKETAILVITDDKRTGNRYETKLLCDQFARAGYLTVMPNVSGYFYQNGTERPHDVLEDLPFNLLPGDLAEPRDNLGKIEQIATALVYLKNVRQRKKIAAASYGRAKWLLAFMNEDPPKYDNMKLSDGTPYNESNYVKIDTAFLADPSTADLSHILEEIERGPLSFALAEDSNWRHTHALEEGGGKRTYREWLTSYLYHSSSPYQFTIYSHVVPGFAVTRKATDKAKIFAKRQAFVQAITFFNEHLLNGD